jgi:hypothetical protein
METRFGVVYNGLVGMERGMHVNREHEKHLALLSPLMNLFFPPLFSASPLCTPYQGNRWRIMLYASQNRRNVFLKVNFFILSSNLSNYIPWSCQFQCWMLFLQSCALRLNVHSVWGRTDISVWISVVRRFLHSSNLIQNSVWWNKVMHRTGVILLLSVSISVLGKLYCFCRSAYRYWGNYKRGFLCIAWNKEGYANGGRWLQMLIGINKIILNCLQRLC